MLNLLLAATIFSSCVTLIFWLAKRFKQTKNMLNPQTDLVEFPDSQTDKEDATPSNKLTIITVAIILLFLAATLVSCCPRC